MLDDENVEVYVKAIFKISPRYCTGTAPAGEWLEFLYLHNEREGRYILTADQLNSITPYCQVNQHVEMTPDDIIRLIYLIRHEKIQPTVVNKEKPRLFDHTTRPRSSSVMNGRRYSIMSNDDNSSNYYHYSDDESINHPGEVKSTCYYS